MELHSAGTQQGSIRRIRAPPRPMGGASRRSKPSSRTAATPRPMVGPQRQYLTSAGVGDSTSVWGGMVKFPAACGSLTKRCELFVNFSGTQSVNYGGDLEACTGRVYRGCSGVVCVGRVCIVNEHGGLSVSYGDRSGVSSRCGAVNGDPNRGDKHG